jgi:hypothetical protein
MGGLFGVFVEKYCLVVGECKLDSDSVYVGDIGVRLCDISVSSIRFAQQ